MKKSISNRNNLLLKVYVIGYSERGESVVVLFTDKRDNSILYSLVIDSFKYKGEHRTISILDDYGIKETKLDMLVWSHPDIDHSFGMLDLLNEYCGDKTRVVLPYDLNGKAWNKVKYNKEDEEIINNILDLTKHKFTSHDTATSSDFLYHPLIEFSVNDDIGSLPVSIMALSPHSTRINYALEANKMIEKNDLSITIMVGVGYDNINKFLFCADTENYDFDTLYPNAFIAPHFVKIPHHGSSTSDLLPGKLQKDGDSLSVACSTIYKSKGLPEKVVLEQYVSLFKQVDCTGRSNSETLNYGCVQYDFDLFDTQTVEIRHYGHAALVDDDYLDNLNGLIPQKKTSKRK